jgi:hypothetical protein
LSSFVRDSTENTPELWNGEYLECYVTVATTYIILLLTCDEFLVVFSVFQDEDTIVATDLDDRDQLTICLVLHV